MNNIQEAASASNTETEGDSITKKFRLWLRANLRGKNHDNSLKEALEEVLEEHEDDDDVMPQEEQEMLKKVLGFGELTVKDIMIPRTDIKAVEYNATLEELKQHLVEYRHTRVPVYNDTLDNIKGFVHIKDLVPLLSSNLPFNMALVLRDVLFVPPSMKLTKLLLQMRENGVHIAIVIDEYGGTDGLVTLEDVFEEIVGEIQDEHDEDEKESALVWNEQGSCDVDARVLIGRIESELGINIESTEAAERDYDTLGGLIFYQLDRVPVSGEKISFNNVVFEILEADPRRIQKVRIVKELVEGE